ncbi:SH3 domain-containing protein [Maricaulis sp. CAU 1757]
MRPITVLARLVVLALTGLAVLTAATHAQDAATPSGQAVPRFVSLKVDVANGRVGPSSSHPIAWRYVRAGLPMEVIAETPDWRRVRDPEGELTWMHRSILSGRRSVYTLADTPLHARDSDNSSIEAVAEPGVVLSLERCRTGWCRVEGQGYRGWVRPDTLWGVYAHELASDETGDADGSPSLSAPAARDTALP